MTITAKHTVHDILVNHSMIFEKKAEHITKIMASRKSPQSLLLSRRGEWLRGDKIIKIHKTEDFTMVELNEVQQVSANEDYFFTVLGICTGLNKEGILKLRFLRAFKLYLDTIEEIKQIANAWSMLSDQGRGTKVERKNRGLEPIIINYIQIMQGAVTRDQAWSTPWWAVYTAFEKTRDDNREERKRHEESMRKQESKRRKRRI